MTDAPATVFCKKLKQQLPALSRQPWPGAMGERIVREISAEAWAAWKEHAKMLINEYRVNLGTDEGRAFIEAQLVAYLFEEGVLREAEGFVPRPE